MNANTNINVLGGILDAMLANLTEHIDKRVEAKVFTLTERIERLETDLTVALLALTERIEKLEEQVGSLMNCQDNDQMENARRITELEQRLSARAVQIESLGIDQRDDAKRIDALENAQRPATTATLDLTSEQFRLAVIKIIDKHTMGDEFLNPLVTALADSGEFVDAVREAAREVARAEAEEAVSDHNSEYDHDDIHPVGEIDEDAVREVIEEVLNNVTVSLKI
jgi:hypothetical protein